MSEDLVTMEPASAEVSIVERLPAEVSTVETVPTEVSTVEPTLAEVSAVEETVDEVPAVEEEPPLSESSIVQPAPVEITPVDAAPGEVIAAEPALAVVPTIEPAPAEVATTQPAPAEVATKEPTPSDVVPVEQAATVLEAVYEQGASEHVEPAQPKVGKQTKDDCLHDNEINKALELDETNVLLLDLNDLTSEISFSDLARSIGRPSVEAADFSTIFRENFGVETASEITDEPEQLSVILETSEADSSYGPSAEASLLDMSIFMTPGFKQKRVRPSHGTILNDTADFLQSAQAVEKINDRIVDLTREDEGIDTRALDIEALTKNLELLLADSKDGVDVLETLLISEEKDGMESFVSGNVQVHQTSMREEIYSKDGTNPSIKSTIVEEVTRKEKRPSGGEQDVCMVETITSEVRTREQKPRTNVSRKISEESVDFVVGWQAVGFSRPDAVKVLESRNSYTEQPKLSSVAPVVSVQASNKPLEIRENLETKVSLPHHTSEVPASKPFEPEFAKFPAKPSEIVNVEKNDLEPITFQNVSSIMKRFQHIEPDTMTKDTGSVVRVSRTRTKSAANEIDEKRNVFEKAAEDPLEKKVVRRSKSLPASPAKGRRSHPVDTAPCLDLAVARFGVSLKRTNVYLPDMHGSSGEQKEPDALEKAVSTVLKSEEQVLEAAEDVKKKTTKKKKKTSDVSVDGEKKKKKKKSTETKERPSYNMSRDIDYSKKIHVRSVDTSKVQKQFSQASDNQTVKICKLCERQVFQMEQVKAEKAVWHKNCFRCNECGKQIMLDTYESHEGVLYCKPHYKQLFQPKAHFEDPEPRFMRKKPEMIIRESQPVQLPPDVARASDKVDHGLDELNSVDLKSRFSLFERKTESQERDLAKSPSQVTVKKAEAILNKVARFQTNGSSHLPGSDSESEPDNEESDIIRSSKKKRERPQSFAAMGDVKQKFAEGTFATESAQRREEFEKEKKEELIKLRARLCAGRQARLKEMYEDSVKESETAVKKTDPEMEVLEKARFLKERFEKACGESEPKVKTLGEEDMCIFEAATVAKQSRNLFKELDANAGKAEVTLRRSQSQMLPNEHRRSMFIASQISNDVIRATDVQEDIAVETPDIASRFTFFETFKQRQSDDDKKEKGRFKFTPPRELGAIQEPHEQEVYRDPTVVRSDDKLQDELPKDTAKKALSIFKQMEMQAANPEALNGPKPLKRFTPPPGYTGGNSDDNSDEESEYESEEDEETDNDEDESENDVVKASDKIEDEFLKITSERAMAKNLRNKFERWEAEMEKENRLNHSQSHLSLYEEEGIEASLETTRDLKARFEALSTEPAKPVLEKPRIKVNRFVEIQQNGNSDVCCGCSQKVYAMERHEGSGRLFHKNCFRCSQCSCVLRLNSFSVNGGRLYCIVHYTQNFKVKGNYEEGFGSELASKNWKGNRVEVNNASK